MTPEQQRALGPQIDAVKAEISAYGSAQRAQEPAEVLIILVKHIDAALTLLCDAAEEPWVEMLKIARGYMRCEGEGWCANASRSVEEVCGACKNGPLIRHALAERTTPTEAE